MADILKGKLRAIEHRVIGSSELGFRGAGNALGMRCGFLKARRCIPKMLLCVGSLSVGERLDRRCQPFCIGRGIFDLDAKLCVPLCGVGFDLLFQRLGLAACLVDGGLDCAHRLLSFVSSDFLKVLGKA
ncbi:MAG: hypothetical protein JO359_11600 [Candidatus Eremiobacteraeota bacterium]|nr:hypothetical protein [Candidatus Eremiobacteraeota bacterium]